MRPCAVVVLVTSSVAGAQPITVNVNGPVRELATQLTTASPCRVVAYGPETVNVAMTNVSLWDVLAKVESQHQIRSSIEYGMIRLESATTNSRRGPRDLALSWTKDWQRFKSFAVAYAPGDRWGSPQTHTGERVVRILVLGSESYSVEKVVIDKATVDGAKIETTQTFDATARPCDPTQIELKLRPPAGATKVSLRGQVVAKLSTIVERRVAIPNNDDVVDVKEGRLRVHVASAPAGTGQRKIYVGWDSMGGDAVAIKVDFVDDKGASLGNGSRSSSGGGGQGHESRTVAWNGMGTMYAVIKIPKTGTGTEHKLPIKFDNVPIEPTP